MTPRRLVPTTLAAATAVATVCAPLLIAGAPRAVISEAEAAEAAPQLTDLDRLMARVVSKRDDNWTRMKQYVLDERETLRVTAPSGAPIVGFVRDYTWFIRDGLFVRSPLRADGVAVSDEERLAFEERWLERERQRLERERAEVATEADSFGAVLDQSMQPRFVSAAYFLELDFDPGRYALVGRERLDGHDVLRVEYYPTRLFDEGRTRPSHQVRERDLEVEEKLNKATVTLWVDPAAEQIRKFSAEGNDWRFLPASWLVRVDEVVGSMTMQEAFEDVWLPDTIELRFRLSLAYGTFTGRYRVDYHDYRLAEVTTTVRPSRR